MKRSEAPSRTPSARRSSRKITTPGAPGQPPALRRRARVPAEPDPPTLSDVSEVLFEHAGTALSTIHKLSLSKGLLQAALKATSERGRRVTRADHDVGAALPTLRHLLDISADGQTLLLAAGDYILETETATPLVIRRSISLVGEAACKRVSDGEETQLELVPNEPSEWMWSGTSIVAGAGFKSSELPCVFSRAASVTISNVLVRGTISMSRVVRGSSSLVLNNCYAECLEVDAAASLEATGSTFSGSASAGIQVAGKLEASGCFIHGNEMAGIICAEQGTVVLRENCIVSHNGGAGLVVAGIGVVRDSIVSDSTNKKGSVHADGSCATITAFGSTDSTSWTASAEGCIKHAEP